MPAYNLQYPRLPLPIHQYHPPVPMNVNDALSKVENDLNQLTYSLHHPHTLNHPTTYNRACNITAKVESLTSMVDSLKRKMTSYENSPSRAGKNLKLSPILRQPSNSPKNV